MKRELHYLLRMRMGSEHIFAIEGNQGHGCESREHAQVLDDGFVERAAAGGYWGVDGFEEVGAVRVGVG